MYKNLKNFLSALDKAGELRYIRHEVSPLLEISKITDQESKSPYGGKALLFEQVEGSS
ncbi:MAG: UbiD family decarboxylase, partial [Deltaproteobacteria bacterium]|nr:UbiD family decarboxylase [Deltaproteobacteria bacterium]MBW2164683.1 UbiD family decarboxylase [Deltaproteobacteria bacterium]